MAQTIRLKVGQTAGNGETFITALPKKGSQVELLLRHADELQKGFIIEKTVMGGYDIYSDEEMRALRQSK